MQNRRSEDLEQPSTAQVAQAKSGQVQAMQTVAIPPAKQVPISAGIRPPAPDDVQIPPLPQDQIPILQPRPQHPQSRLRYDPPAVGNAGVLHPAPVQESKKAENPSMPAQNPVSKSTEQQAPVVQDTPGASTYQPPPLNRNRSQEENVNRAQSRNSTQASVGENPSTIYTIHENEPPKPAGPPPPPPKIPLQNVQQSAIIFSPVEYAASEAASPQLQSPSGIPLPDSKATSPAPSRNQSLLRQAVSSSSHAPQSAGITGQDAVAVQSSGRPLVIADSDSEPKSDMLVKEESLKPVDTEAEREPPATAVGVRSPAVVPPAEDMVVKAVEVTSVKPAEVKAPEVKAPEVKAPEVKAPEVKAPEVKLPEMKVPEVASAEDQGALVTGPEPRAPEIMVPILRVPEVTVPEIKAPEINVPDIRPDSEVRPSVAKPSNAEEEAKKLTPGQLDHTNAVELPAMRFGEDDEPVMKATSYPGDEWVPRWDPE
jgi:hypothetical protein